MADMEIRKWDFYFFLLAEIIQQSVLLIQANSCLCSPVVHSGQAACEYVYLKSPLE